MVHQVSRSKPPEDVDTPQKSRHFPGAQFDVVALASSAGGIAAISHILESLPAGFPAAIKSGHADFILRLDEIPLALTTLVTEGVVR